MKNKHTNKNIKVPKLKDVKKQAAYSPNYIDHRKLPKLIEKDICKSSLTQDQTEISELLEKVTKGYLEIQQNKIKAYDISKIVECETKDSSCKEELNKDSKFKAILKSAGLKKIWVTFALRSATGFEYKEIASIVESTPSLIKDNLSKEDALELKKRIEVVGGVVECINISSEDTEIDSKPLEPSLNIVSVIDKFNEQTSKDDEVESSGNFINNKTTLLVEEEKKSPIKELGDSSINVVKEIEEQPFAIIQSILSELLKRKELENISNNREVKLSKQSSQADKTSPYMSSKIVLNENVMQNEIENISNEKFNEFGFEKDVGANIAPVVLSQSYNSSDVTIDIKNERKSESLFDEIENPKYPVIIKNELDLKAKSFVENSKLIEENIDNKIILKPVEIENKHNRAETSAASNKKNEGATVTNSSTWNKFDAALETVLTATSNNSSVWNKWLIDNKKQRDEENLQKNSQKSIDDTKLEVIKDDNISKETEVLDENLNNLYFVSSSESDKKIVTYNIPKPPKVENPIEQKNEIKENLWSVENVALFQAVKAKTSNGNYKCSWGDLVKMLNLEDKETVAYSKDRFNKICSALKLFNIGVEIENSNNNLIIKENDRIVLYSIIDQKEIVDKSNGYSLALLTLQVSSAICIADNDFSNSEVAFLEEKIKSWTHLSQLERNKLYANLQTLVSKPLQLVNFRHKLKVLSSEEKISIAGFLVSVVHADNVVHSKEIMLLEKIYQCLGFDQNSVYTDLHKVASDSPVIRTPNEKVGFMLNAAKIAELKKDTEKVTDILSSIFIEEEAIIKSSPIVIGPIKKDNNSQFIIQGLNPQLNAMVHILISQSTWDRKSLEHSIVGLKLMLDGALEQINDVCFDQFEMPLIEGDDPLVINIEILEYFK